MTNIRLPVALRKESVDRNTLESGFSRCARLSLSARRAWIEIGNYCERSGMLKVALRKESVDRNTLDSGFSRCARVALRKESVDRNHFLGGVTHG